MIIGELYSGIRVVDLELASAVTAEAAVSEIATIAVTGGLPVNVGLSMGSDGKAHVILKSESSVPLAVRPAFVARPLTGITMGDASVKNHDPATIRWERFDPQLPSHASLISEEITSVIQAAYTNNILP
jgi:hypothetical protein